MPFTRRRGKHGGQVPLAADDTQPASLSHRSHLSVLLARLFLPRHRFALSLLPALREPRTRSGVGHRRAKRRSGNVCCRRGGGDRPAEADVAGGLNQRT